MFIIADMGQKLYTGNHRIPARSASMVARARPGTIL